MQKGSLTRVTRLRNATRRLRGTNRPRLRRFKFGKLGKIKGAVELQRICKVFSIPFEPIKVYSGNSRFLWSDIEGAERILFRTEDRRMEYVLKGASSERLNGIAEHIKRTISIIGKSKFAVQRVGLRQNIERYGTIIVNNKIIQYYEAQHNAAKAKDEPAFLLGGFWGGTPQFEFKGNKLSTEARKFIDEKIGNANAHRMVQYLVGRAAEEITLRFVKYKGKKQCFFYDMHT